MAQNHKARDGYYFEFMYLFPGGQTVIVNAEAIGEKEVVEPFDPLSPQYSPAFGLAMNLCYGQRTRFVSGYSLIIRERVLTKEHGTSLLAANATLSELKKERKA